MATLYTTNIDSELAAAHTRGRQHDRKHRTVPLHPAPTKAQTKIPANLRQMLARRVTRQNRQEFNPTIAALQRQKQQLLPAYQREVASAEGYVDLASEAVQSVSVKGLRGPYKRQVATELANRAADIEQSAPILAQEARQDYQSAKSAAQQKIIDARLAKQKAISTETASALSGARTDLHALAVKRAAAAKERKDERLDNQKKVRKQRTSNRAERRQELQSALHEADILLNFEDNAEQRTRLEDGSASADDWGGLEKLIRSAEGVGYQAARRAIEILKDQYGY